MKVKYLLPSLLEHILNCQLQAYTCIKSITVCGIDLACFTPEESKTLKHSGIFLVKMQHTNQCQYSCCSEATEAVYFVWGFWMCMLKVSVLQSTFDCLISTLTRKSSYTVPPFENQHRLNSTKPAKSFSITHHVPIAKYQEHKRN